MNTIFHRTTHRPAWSVIALVVVAALAGLFFWQQHQLTKQQQRMESQNAENKQLTGLREELVRLRRLEVDPNELARLRQAQIDGQLEIARLRAQVNAAKRANAEAADQRAALASQSAASPGANQAIAAPMAEMVKGSLEQVLQRRLSRMGEKLNLSSAQAQALREILTQQYRGVAEAMQGVYAGKVNRQKLAELRGNRGNPDDQIRALLSPEQLTVYAAMQEEDAMNNARLAANGELIQMQNSLALTSDQPDKVFAILYEQIHQQYKEESTGNAPANPAEALKVRQKRQLAALEGVLTPSQLEGYRVQQDQKIQFMEKLAAQMDPGERP